MSVSFKILFRVVQFNLLFLVAPYIYAAPNSDQAYFKQFQDVFNKVNKEYVQEVDKQKMVDAAISGMLSSLDPHSNYFADEEVADFLNQTKGEFGGIGVEIICEQGNIKVIAPLEDLPAYKAGIKSGDYIIGVNGELTSSLGCNKAIKEMKGDPGTKVKLLVAREDENKPIEVEITRDIVKINPIKTSLEDQNIAYIKIITFNNNTVNDLKQQFQKLEKQTNNNIQGILLDLRNNPGGLLEQAVGVSDFFLPSGVIVSIKGRKTADIIVKSANRFTAKAPNIPIVVLINGGSASASEIVAGALQDHKRAVIIGTKSFGKGSVQAFMDVSPRAAIKLTTSKYYTPNERSIQAEGIEPDIIIEPAKVEYPEGLSSKWHLSESSLKNYLKNDKDSSKEKPMSKDVNTGEKNTKSEEKNGKSELYKKDYQYARAYDLIRGLILTYPQSK